MKIVPVNLAGIAIEEKLKMWEVKIEHYFGVNSVRSILPRFFAISTQACH